MSGRNTQGFTIVEIVITLALITIVLGISVAGFSSLGTSRQLDSATEIAASVFEEARSRSLAAQDDTEWGVHVESTQLVIFAGDTYDAGDPGNKVHILPDYVTISDITLTGGGNDVVFARRTGAVSAYGSVTLVRSQDATESRTLSISAAGLIE
jgi:prepilin-type N-terminal cleavage/methylation domain-containing protein